MLKVDKDGVSNRAHLEQVEKTTGKKPEALEEPDMPHELEYLWCWFLQMHAARQRGFGIQPINFSEIFAWCNLSNIKLTPWEVETIRLLDNQFMSVSNA